MKPLRLIFMLLLSMTATLMIVQTALAQQKGDGGRRGHGGKGSTAAVGIEGVVLFNPAHPSDHFIRAEIAGGGFLGGDT